MDRHILLDGCVNFRDVGGYQVARSGLPASPPPRMRWRRLFRSDALNELSAADVALLTGDLRITTVVDLRTDYERQRDAPRPLDRTSVQTIHAPLINERNAGAAERPGLTLAERYVWILELAGEPLVRAIATVAGAPGAVIVHCAAGKDRTGLVIASILGALGVGDDDIVADYARTTDSLEGIEQRLLRRSESYETVPGAVLDAPAEAMREVLAALRDQHGSVGGFLSQAGVGQPVLDELAATLVELP
ncbi:MAG TPA: tyrosine-protein phosphatase [Streptosporangiaceae bacterium]|nr:tyrosine-protein phosphatase [Streptosporangiaceae bacterium]